MNTLTLTADEVDLIVRVVVPAAGKDQLLPVFTNVRISAEGGVLYAAATDRYKMCRAKLREGITEDFAILVPAAWFTAATSTLRLYDRRLGPKGNLETTISWGPVESVKFRAVGVPKGRTLGHVNQLAIEFYEERIEGTWPKMDHLFEAPPASMEFGASGYTMPPASMLGASAAWFVPPTDGSPVFHVVDPEGRWTWAGMSMRMPHPRATSVTTETAEAVSA